MISTIAISALFAIPIFGAVLTILLVLLAIVSNVALYYLNQQYEENDNACFGLGAVIGSIFGGLSSGLVIAGKNIIKALLQAISASAKGGYLDYKYGTGNNNASC